MSGRGVRRGRRLPEVHPVAPLARRWLVERHEIPVEIAIVTDKENHLLNLQPFQRFGQLTVLGVGVAAVALEVGVAAELHPEFGRDIRGG